MSICLAIRLPLWENPLLQQQSRALHRNLWNLHLLVWRLRLSGDSQLHSVILLKLKMLSLPQVGLHRVCVGWALGLVFSLMWHLQKGPIPGQIVWCLVLTLAQQRRVLGGIKGHLPGHPSLYTFFSWNPLWCLSWICFSPHFPHVHSLRTNAQLFTTSPDSKDCVPGRGNFSLVYEWTLSSHCAAVFNRFVSEKVVLMNRAAFLPSIVNCFSCWAVYHPPSIHCSASPSERRGETPLVGPTEESSASTSIAPKSIGWTIGFLWYSLVQKRLVSAKIDFVKVDSPLR